MSPLSKFRDHFVYAPNRWEMTITSTDVLSVGHSITLQPRNFNQTTVLSYKEKHHFIAIPQCYDVLRKCIWKCCLQNMGHFIHTSMYQLHSKHSWYILISMVEEKFSQWGKTLHDLRGPQSMRLRRYMLNVFSHWLKSSSDISRIPVAVSRPIDVYRTNLSAAKW